MEGLALERQSQPSCPCHRVGLGLVYQIQRAGPCLRLVGQALALARQIQPSCPFRLQEQLEVEQIDARGGEGAANSS